ncbi:MAG: GAF domain-containing protein [Thermacetogeniaceae bacterium]
MKLKRLNDIISRFNALIRRFHWDKDYYQEILRRNTQLEIINEIAKSITVEMSFSEMMDSITKKLHKVISYDLLSFCLLEQGKLVISTGVPKDVPVLGVGTVLDPDTAMTWKVVKEKKFLIRYDLLRDSCGFGEDQDLLSLGIRSVIIVPLLVKNEVIGTLNLGSKESFAYSTNDAVFLQQVADQLALCIENARLYAEETRLKQEWEKSFRNAECLAKEMSKRNLQLEIINQLAKSVTVETSFDEMLDNMAVRLQKVISYDLLSFCLLEEGALVIKKGIPKDQTYLGEGAILHLYQSAPGKVVREGKFFIRPDIPNDQNHFHEDEDLQKLGINSAVMVPLIVKQRVIGTLNLGSKHKNTYTEEDARFLQQVADHLALFIENIRLYTEASRSKIAWEETFQAVTDILVVVDHNYQIVRFNKAAEKLHQEKGVPPRVNQKCYEYFHPAHKKCRLCPIWEVFQTGRPVSRRMHLRSGKIWDVVAYPICGEDGAICEVIISIRDITEKVHMEAQLIQSAKLAAIGEIAAGVAHELNSPLTAIIGNALILKRDAKIYPPDKEELIDDIKKCGIRCKRIIENLRIFSRQEEYNFELLNLNDVVKDALTLVSYQIEKNCIEIIEKLQEDLPLVSGSKQHIEQVVINFLLNARDSLEGRAIRRIYIRTGTANNFVFVAVEDTGCGIKPEDMEQIFNPFYTTKEKIKGTGLGLSISRSIAEAHGGKIEVKSEVGVGSTFSLLIPLIFSSEGEFWGGEGGRTDAGTATDPCC